MLRGAILRAGGAAKLTLDRYLRGEDERRVLERKMKAEGRLPPGQSLTLK